ncbi:MAG: hypothetical protein ATN31_03540 [Candidatus Epulonipiscioides saccharophilum]|nr:MAG: hypothetical protein ATN31_03540 [Epulopiscium sp. AS2M-Bin001]
MLKKQLAILCSLSLILGLTGCTITNATSIEKGQVYYLNFKPEVELIWLEIAEKYTEKTGIDVKVITNNGTKYADILEEELHGPNPPTLFHVNGPVNLVDRQSDCLDLTDYHLYHLLTSKDLALYGEDEIVYGLPLSIEGYGILYNASIMERYFNIDGSKAKSMDEINNFETLKIVVEDMQAKKDQLNITGVFGTTSLFETEEWRWHTHLLNIPIYFEFEDKGISDSETIDFLYHENFKNIFDLYLNNSTLESELTKNRTVVDSLLEFTYEEVAMIQNGNWVWNQIKDIKSKSMSSNCIDTDNIKFLPIYMNLDGEEEHGLVIGNENYLSINANASKEDIQATKDFLDWLLTSTEGKNIINNDLGYIAPYTSFSDDEKPSNPLTQAILDEINTNQEIIPWIFTVFPGQDFKNFIGTKLTEYATGDISWNEFKDHVIQSWAEEKRLLESK